MTTAHTVSSGVMMLLRKNPIYLGNGYEMLYQWCRICDHATGDRVRAARKPFKLNV